MTGQALLPKQGILLVILATFCWGTSGLFISLVLHGSNVSPLGLAFWRDLSTFTCLFSGLALFRPKLLRVQRRDLPWLAVMGALSIGFFHVMWNMAVLINGVSVATVIQANAPIFVTLMAWLLWREPLTGRKISAVALAFSGFALYTTALQRLPASVAAIVATMEVPFAAIISYAALGERLEMGQVLGAVLVSSGVLWLSWPPK